MKGILLQMKLAGGIPVPCSNENQTADTHRHHHHYVVIGDRRIMLYVCYTAHCRIAPRTGVLYNMMLYKT